MLRVCGITFSHSPNYGSCLQTYALQRAVESQTICGEECMYRVIPVQMFKDYPGIGITSTIIKPFMAWNRLSYRSFYKKYMHYVKCNRFSELPELNQRFDAFVCGSDVIWNDSINHHVSAYFLDFAEKYRFSYAASFGKAEISDEFVRFVGDKIDRLNAVSVREPSAVQIAERFTQKPVAVVSDPVLLVDRTEWNRIAGERIEKKPYIFVYATHLNENLERYIAKLKEITQLPVVWSVSGPKQAIRKRVFKMQKPEEWVRLLRDAEYVVTNSFHASVFSVLFHKRFFTVVHGEKNKGINVRMNDFLNALGLEDRIFSSVPDELDLSEIDYSEVDQKIEAMREEALAFLRQNLEAAYRQKTEEDGQISDKK